MRVCVSGSPNCFSSSSFSFFNASEAAAARVAIHAFRVVDVKNGITRRAALDPLQNRREKAASPGAFAARRVTSAADQDDEPRQVLAFGTEPISDPRPHRRAAEPGRTG